jgi:hypothetical protein
MNKLSYSEFKQAYQSILEFEETNLDDGRIMLYGGNAYHRITLTLIRSAHGTDTLDLAYLRFDNVPEITPPGRDATTFLSMFFSDSQHAREWFDIAYTHPPIYESEQDGIILRLSMFSPIPQYPYVIFNLSARPCEPV